MFPGFKTPMYVRVVDGCVIDLEIFKARKDHRDLDLWLRLPKLTTKFTPETRHAKGLKKTSFCLPKLGDILLGTRG